MEKNNPPLETLKNRRITLKFSIRDMANGLGISKSMYSALEQGTRRLTYEQAQNIADILDTNPNDLFLEDFSKHFKKLSYYL